MKHRTIYLLFIIFSLLMFSSQIDARKLIPDSTGNQGSGKVKAEDCKAATAFNYLDLNNVRCRINTGGDMWWDLQSLPQYEIPKGSKKHSMFSAALWIGGKDVNGNVRVAAQRYRGYGNDFYTGPLTIDGLADVSPEKCKEFDRHFILYRRDVEKFVAAKANPELYEGYQRPAYFDEYPAHGDVSQGYSYYLAPFYDTDGDGNYNPAAGDYPYYDLKNELSIENPTPTMAGNGILKDQILKGDMTLFWIFNDKGADHTETRGDPIGFEIRGQAFAFSTNDELNDMTFYSYEIINRSTFSLDSTYFSQWVDPDVGYAQDDYLGCDVKRGLGYCYNGEATDGTGQQAHYGDNPPAIGVDFFQGPYMNPLIDSVTGEAIPRKDTDSLGNPLCDESINGLNFDDTIAGNERFGMRRFLYHNNTGGDLGDPSTYDEYYWMLKGFWKGGRDYPMQFGGDAFPGHPNVSPVRCTFMFPGDTDPCWWGTKDDPENPSTPGINVIEEYGWAPSEEGVHWTEKNEGNDPDDRRFMQSAGPFTLKPGAVNYITVGIPWVPGTGNVKTTLNNLKKADDLCQDLFIQNFRIINGPDAPVVEVQELNEQLVLYLDYLPCQPGSLSNYGSGCNYQGRYVEYDYTIKNIPGEPKKDTLYRFEGYQVYQVKDASVSATDLDDPAKARLIAQCDIKNGIGRLINYSTNATLGVEEAELMVDGSDQGIKHTFVVSRDQFAAEGDKLINNKRYYFMAIAYAYNEWQQYIPGIGGQDGQRTPYLGSRKASGGGSIRAVEAIPHIPTVENGGTILNSEYGDGVEITRLEGTGNGELPLRLKDETIEDIMDGESPFPVVDSLPGNDWRHDILQYQQGYGPLDIKVVDPLNVVESDFSLRFATENIDWSHPSSTLGQALYEIVDLNNQNEIESHRAIDVKYEQLLIDYGISVSVFQPLKPIAQEEPRFNLMYEDAFIEAEKLYENEQLEWLTGVPDNDLNINNDDWIASGTVQGSDYGLQITNPETGRTEKWYYDQTEQFENVLGGTWAPYGLSKVVSVGGPAAAASNSDIKDFIKLKELNSVLVVITKDQSKWTRSPVVETGGNYTASSSDDLIEGRIEEDGDTIFPNRMSLRYGKSIDKDGNPWSGHDTVSSDNPNDPNYIGGYGMGWFPGYAINLETGERLNIIYGENSKYCPENGYDNETGRDMMWNPTSTYNLSSDEQIRGGMHYLYIMDIGVDTVGATFGDPFILDMPGYDAGNYIYDIYHTPSSEFNGDLRRVAFQKAMWTTMPLLAEGREFLESDLQIYMNVSRQYNRYYATTDEDNMGMVQENDGYPYYEFNTRGLGTTTGNKQTAKNALDLIRIVPNPYNAFSDYEEDQLDTRIKITNLPVKCKISIYTINGVLIREYTRDDKTITSQDWDLKNYAGIPISSGVYLIHVDAEGIGERVLKFFCTMRPTDLNAF